MQQIKMTIILFLFLFSSCGVNTKLYDKKSSGINVKLFDTNNSGISENHLKCLTIGKDGSKWIGTMSQGLLKYNNGSFEKIDSEKKVIKANSISSLYTDSNGKVWLLFKESNNEFCIANYDGKRWKTFTKEEMGLDRVPVHHIFEGINGDIYFGGGNTLIVYNNNKWKSIKLPEGVTSVRTVAVNNEGVIAMDITTVY